MGQGYVDNGTRGLTNNSAVHAQSGVPAADAKVLLKEALPVQELPHERLAARQVAILHHFAKQNSEQLPAGCDA